MGKKEADTYIGRVVGYKERKGCVSVGRLGVWFGRQVDSCADVVEVQVGAWHKSQTRPAFLYLCALHGM